MERGRTLRRVFKGKQKRKHSHKALSSWESMYNALHNHPLTQAKIVNEQLLQSTHESLHKIEHTIVTSAVKYIPVVNSVTVPCLCLKLSITWFTKDKIISIVAKDIAASCQTILK